MNGIPHLKLPLQLALDKTLVTVEQDTPDDVAQCVEVILTTDLGSRIEDPAFGIEPPEFRSHLDAGSIQSALVTYEPRASHNVQLQEYQDGDAVAAIIEEVRTQ